MNQNITCDPPAHPQRWLIMILVGVGTFMSTLDVSILNVALPTLRSYFNASVTTAEWFALAYTFVITSLLLIFGKLGDNIGRKYLYLYGIIVFVIGSVACGFSVSAAMLILARGLQGIGSSMTMSAGPAFVTEGFPARERGKAVGFIGTAVALGLLAGPVIGGLILHIASWRWLFFINIPVGAVLAYLLATRIEGFAIEKKEKLDVFGSVFMAASLAAFLVALTQGGHIGWTSPMIIFLFITSAFALAAFIVHEKRTPRPIIDPELFRNRGFVIGAAAGWANYAAMMPVSIFMPFYLQDVLNYKPVHIGLMLASGPLTMAIVAPIAGSLSDRIGYRFLTSSGLFIVAIGALFLQGVTASFTWLDVVWRLMFASLGSALFVSPNSSSILGSVNCGQLGIASGTIALVRNLGMVCGIAIAGAIIATFSRDFTLPGFKAAMIASAIIALSGASISAMRTPAIRGSIDDETRSSS